MLTTIEERLLIHRVWSRWSSIRKTLYGLLRIKNMEDLISAIKEGRVTADIFIDIIKSKSIGIESSSLNEKDEEEIYKRRVRLISIFDEDYPQELLNMQNITDKIYPPLLLYILTRREEVSFNAKPIISIVGTRECTPRGAKIAYDIASRLSSTPYHYTIATGLARGIDRHATLGVLDSNGTIIGVRPYLFPIDYVHKSEYERIVDNGYIIAENLTINNNNNTRWIKMNLYLRNRIITGIAKAVIVVEARARKHSGSMHQIEFALKRDKPVFIFKTDDVEDKELVAGYKEYKAKGVKDFTTVDELVRLIEAEVEINNTNNKSAHYQRHAQQRIDTPY